MIVKLDLRPESIKNVKPPKTRKIWLFMVCMFMVFGSAVSYAWFVMAKDILFLQGKIRDLSHQVSNLNTVRTGLRTELARLDRQEQVYVSSLSIMQEELPTIEVFNAIERSLVSGVTLNSLALSDKNLKLDGVANTEDNIVQTARSLLDRGTFSHAQVPVVTRTGTGPEGLNFSLSLAPLSIGEAGRR